MALARTFTERIATALLSLVASGMALGGVAMAGLGATLRQTGFAMEGMPVITGGLMAVGAVLALSGGMSMIWTYAAGYSGARLSVAGGTRVIMLLLFATALPVAVATQLGALAEYWQDVARLAAEYEVWESANGPSALVFAPVMGVLLVPGVQAIAAIVMALSCALAVVLVLARSGAAHRLVTIGALLAAGLTIASWVGVAVTERLAPGVETLVRTTAAPGAQEQDRALALLQRHRAVVTASAWTLSWALVAVALLAAGTRAVSRVAVSEDRIAADPAALHSLDETTRAEALLEAADRLHRTTPPVRRF